MKTSQLDPSINYVEQQELTVQVGFLRVKRRFETPKCGSDMLEITHLKHGAKF